MGNKDSSQNPENPKIGFALYRTSLAMRQLMQKEFNARGYNITTEQWSVMNRVMKENSLSQNEIAERLHKQKPNVSRIIEELEKNKLVIRKISEGDKRKYKVFLTDKGINLTAELRIIVREVREKACEGISQEELSATANILNTMYNNISLYRNS